MGETVTQEHLKKYKGWKMRVESDEERIARANSEETFPAMRDGGGSQRQAGRGDRMERAIARRAELEEKLLPRIKETKRKIEAVEDAVAAIDDPLQEEILMLRYMFDDGSVRLMRWREVACRIWGDDDEKYLKAAQRLHDEAIGSLERLNV